MRESRRSNARGRCPPGRARPPRRRAVPRRVSPPIHAENSEAVDTDVIQELLVDQLRDILHAEKLVLKALPKMIRAAHSMQLQQLLETHLQESEAQVERVNECFALLDIQARAKPCKRMMGIVEEREE